ncbi:hypothetical protein [Paradevosia shaoguanensis]|uniref:Uncharacterized protein n=1 Tax=Paradevosia shaoguanensis TaxID=1335043 RepID=A0AA41QS71_9HYPH|nr:hypothetical protein [Paradevosia shaoguanensis]MCF1744193.1 hypothetical protein [Paradevosia shaoguanensis]MCI0128676.1 hypothetical protein [Paradevosia shaoguanensis]
MDERTLAMQLVKAETKVRFLEEACLRLMAALANQGRQGKAQIGIIGRELRDKQLTEFKPDLRGLDLSRAEVDQALQLGDIEGRELLSRLIVRLSKIR